MQTAQPDSHNRRDHPRVQFFRLRLDEGFVPVFAFAPADAPDVFAALVVDFSEGGIQVVCGADEFVEAPMYECTLVDDHMQTNPDVGSWLLSKVWSRQEGLYCKAGFELIDGARVPPEAVGRIERADHHLLRCLLRPLRRID